ncbi:MAG: S41 family peptidase, partial [Bacteroidia bacterium]|nr:S41 family peptidase [Bacteroidia bacterium]
DEASDIDWNRFAVYGTAEIMKCGSTNELINTLNELFKPIAPSIRFIKENEKNIFNIEELRPPNLSDSLLTYWQHKGISVGMIKIENNAYQSIRVNRDSVNNYLFDYRLKNVEFITENIGSGVICQMPISLYFDANGTFPKAEKKEFDKLQSKLDSIETHPKDLSVRLGNIITTFNVFQHFYPYFEVVDVNWEDEFRKALKRSFSDQSSYDHQVTLQKFTSPLKDGHISVFYKHANNFWTPAISWEWVEEQLVVTEVQDSSINLKPGEIINEIDWRTSKTYFEEINSRISAATNGWRDYLAQRNSLYGRENSTMRIKTKEGKEVELIRDRFNLEKKSKKEFDIIEDDIFYLNLDAIEMAKINKLLPDIKKCKSIICDMRGYPNGNHDFIRYLLNTDDTTQAWMHIPQIVYPDYKKIAGFEDLGWSDFMKKQDPYLGNKNIIFITDGRAISYAESFMGYIEGYKLATIIGQPTAGTNGNVNQFELNGGYIITFTGMKVTKHNGSQHHGIGILPDIYLTKTIKGISEKRDEFLEKAIELARND